MEQLQLPLTESPKPAAAAAAPPFHSEPLRIASMKATNPLGFLAALGAQAAFTGADNAPRLHWTDDVYPHAVITGASEQEVVSQAITQLSLLRKSYALDPRKDKDNPNKPKNDLKLAPQEIRRYLQQASDESELAERLASALLAEAALDEKGQKAKPTDLYFTAGNQEFAKMCQEIMDAASRDDGEGVRKALITDAPYDAKAPTLMWDVRDDRNYALMHRNPSGLAKIAHPGLESFAIMGISAYPAFMQKRGNSARTIISGAAGSWKRTTFTYPIWDKPATLPAVRSLIAQASYPPDNANSGVRETDLIGWGVTKIMQTTITRTDQGGYGAFLPPKIIWQA